MATGESQLYSAEHDPRPSVVGDGTGDYVQVDAWGVAREAAGSADTVGTLTAWVLIKSQSDSYSILSAGDTSAIEYINFQIVNGLLNITLADGGAVAFDIEADGDLVPINEWTHIAVVQDGVQPRLYKNGVRVTATNDVSTNLTKWFTDLNGIDNANIGILDQNTSTTLDIDGAIGEVKHYNAALTEAEVLIDFQGKRQSAATAALLISHWKWDGDLLDSVAGHNGTAVGNLYQDIQRSNLTAYIESKAWVLGDEVVMAVTPGSNGRNVFHFLRIEA